jgi:hypothetical protein
MLKIVGFLASLLGQDYSALCAPFCAVCSAVIFLWKGTSNSRLHLKGLNINLCTEKDYVAPRGTALFSGKAAKPKIGPCIILSRIHLVS